MQQDISTKVSTKVNPKGPFILSLSVGNLEYYRGTIYEGNNSILYMTLSE